jgi:hypothetical protein
MNVGRGVALTVTGRGGQLGGKSRRNRKQCGGMNLLDGAATLVGDFVKGTTGTMTGAVQGVAGATGTLIQGTTGAAANATTGFATTLSNVGQGALNTARAVVSGGGKSRKNRKNRKANRKANRKH